MPNRRFLARPLIWGAYVVIVLEFLFMISPFALYFYSSYGPALNVEEPLQVRFEGRRC